MTSVAARIAAIAVADPHQPAVLCEGEVVTYEELVASAHAVAAALLSEGLRPETHVVVQMPRTPDLVAVLVGTLHAGLAYVPVDPDLPAARLTAIVAAVRPGAVLTSAPEPPDGPVPETAGEPHPEQVAYTIFTSGSTGNPKGVSVTHGGLDHFLDSVDPLLGSTRPLRVLAATALSFDVAVLDILWPLTRGHCVCLASDAEASDPRALLRMIAAAGVDVAQATPSRWGLLLGAGPLPPGVTVLTGGEALLAPLAAELIAGAESVVNFYGPTETTVYSLAERVTRPSSPPTIGALLGTTTCSVRDSSGAVAPDGAEGELWLGGPGLARGYLCDPRRTAAAFVPDDSGPSGARAYRTGDVVRRVGDEIEFLGRADHQIKLRGFRIELGDIEANALSHPDVAHAVALVENESIWLCYVATTGSPVDGLSDFLRARLPEYMVPDELRQLVAMPLTPAGKADRVRLRADLVAAGRTAGNDPPVTDVMAELLGASAFGPETDFFEAGGTSLLAARLAARLSRSHGVSLTAGAVIRLRTAAAVEAEIASLRTLDVAAR